MADKNIHDCHLPVIQPLAPYENHTIFSLPSLPKRPLFVNASKLGEPSEVQLNSPRQIFRTPCGVKGQVPNFLKIRKWGSDSGHWERKKGNSKKTTPFLFERGLKFLDVSENQPKGWKREEKSYGRNAISCAKPAVRLSLPEPKARGRSARARQRLVPDRR